MLSGVSGVRILYKQKKQSARSRKEIRLMSRLRTNRSQNLDEAGKARETSKRRHLLGQRKKKVRSTTHTTKKRFFLSHDSSDNQNTIDAT